MGITIITNNVPRDLICGFELNDETRKDFDYLTDMELNDALFVRYKGCLYCIDEFIRLPKAEHDLEGWDGAAAAGHFSGVVIRFTNDYEQAVLGTYII